MQRHPLVGGLHRKPLTVAGPLELLQTQGAEVVWQQGLEVSCSGPATRGCLPVCQASPAVVFRGRLGVLTLLRSGRPQEPPAVRNSLVYQAGLYRNSPTYQHCKEATYSHESFGPEGDKDVWPTDGDGLFTVVLLHI